MRILLLLASIFLVAFYGDSKIDFIQNNIPAAQDRASREGKMVVVQFGAKWCQPCLFMDDNTWSNPQIIDYVGQHFVPVKVDVDDFEGLVFRDRYQIRFYPTVLIFNSKGQLVKKHEGMLGSEAMLGLLQSWVSKENMPVVNRPPGEVAAAEKIPEPVAPIVHSQPPVSDETPSGEMDYNSKIDREPLPERPDFGQKPMINQPKARVPARPVAPKTNSNLRQNLPDDGFTVQIGVFVIQASADREAARIGKKFGKKVWLVEASLKGKRVYRGLVGEFSSLEIATSFKKKIKSGGDDAVIKTWQDIR